MSDPARTDRRVYATLESLSRAAAEALVSLAHQAIEQHDRFAIALSGGHTPRALYHLLPTTHRAVIPWRKVQACWGDERYVPPDDARGSCRMAKEALLDHVPKGPAAESPAMSVPPPSSPPRCTPASPASRSS